VSLVESSKMTRVIAVAAALIAAGCIISSDGDAALASAESAPTGGAAPAALAGVYRTEVLGSRGRFNGDAYPSRDTTRWYSIRSSCAETGCTAHASQIVDDDQPAAPTRGRSFDLSFQHGFWLGQPASDASPCLADPDREVTLSVGWRLETHPDGSLTGTRSLTEPRGDGTPCSGSGGVYDVPVVLIPVAGAPK
jgi:hypothetical protein